MVVQSLLLDSGAPRILSSLLCFDQKLKLSWLLSRGQILSGKMISKSHQNNPLPPRKMSKSQHLVDVCCGLIKMKPAIPQSTSLIKASGRHRIPSVRFSNRESGKGF